MSELTQSKNFQISDNTKRGLWALIFLGVLALVIGFLWQPERTWANFLLNAYYFLCLSVGALLFSAIQYVSGARWSEVLRRIPESMASYIPVGGVIVLALFFGMHSLYEWSHEDTVAADHLLSGKAIYLNIPFFFIRVSIAILLWTFFSKLMRENSLRQDESGDFKFFRQNIKLSAIFIFLFAFTLSAMSYDLIMSLEPHWFSTIFAVYNFAGLFVNGLVVIALLSIYLKEKGYFTQFTPDHMHDLAKFIFAFSIFWAYIWFSQFLLIWYGNMPEETVYFYRRFHSSVFQPLFFINFFMNFIVPFFVLMTRNAKRNPQVVKGLCLWMLVAHWLDIYLMVMPGALGDKAGFGFLEFVLPFGFAAVFLFVALRNLSAASLLPKASPFLEESLHHHQ